MPPESQDSTQIEEQTEGSSFADKVKANRGFLIGILVAMAFMGLCLLPVFLYFLLRGSGTEIFNNDVPTPFATDVLGGLPIQTPIVIGLDEMGTISTTVDIPATLTLNGRSFTVQPQLISESGAWSPDVGEDSAAWVYGTIVNYVFGLPNTNDNQATLDLLGPGDEFDMVTQDGVPYVFSFESKDVVMASDRDIYTQQSPGATIILTGGSKEDRLVVKGRYVVSETDPYQANICQVGEMCQVGNMEIAVTGTAYDPSQGNAPTGFAYYRVDYQIENIGGSAIDTSNLQLSLTDELGNQYAMNPMASQSGNYPVLSGPLNVGQIIQATAGYQVPESLESGTVQWVITDVSTGAQIQVVIDYGGGDNAAQQTNIALLSATITDDQASLLLDGQITNLGSQQVVVTQSGLSLRTSDGASFLLLATNPELPWTIPPGQTLQFFVQYQNPQAETAVFTILNQSFQLNFVR